MLIVFGGLPGTGKTTVSRDLARRWGATWLRIDTIEQAMRAAGCRTATVGVAAYAVAQSLAADNLAGGRTVVADCVNPVAASRRGWADVAHRAGVRMIAVHLVCSDAVAHRRRIETRSPDIPGQPPLAWQDVADRDFEPWPEADLVVDTAGLAPEAVMASIAASLDGAIGTAS